MISGCSTSPRTSEKMEAANLIDAKTKRILWLVGLMFATAFIGAILIKGIMAVMI